MIMNKVLGGRTNISKVVSTLCGQNSIFKQSRRALRPSSNRLNDRESANSTQTPLGSPFDPETSLANLGTTAKNVNPVKGPALLGV